MYILMFETFIAWDWFTATPWNLKTNLVYEPTTNQGYNIHCFDVMLITSVEREVKDSRRSGMYQSWLFWQDWACKVCRFSVLFGYLTKWEPNKFEISRDHFDFVDWFFNFFEEERIFILAFPGFEPTHLCDPSDQRRL